ncbi:hypothetical protein SAMN05444164_4777 [Bradyrhizobium erythrophlei]|uniref:Uncharacterized protein n=1 Tax=Bradyrhizobium erythrophlei TaxID=1437360 RepID=A0A1H5ATB2_9BRAD|nr:hypothetical protein SAMN05444164_4777 [Bradyrhizobium erythrophlei]
MQRSEIAPDEGSVSAEADPSLAQLSQHVVPAKAGTHNHRCEWRDKPSPLVPFPRAAAYGSRVKPGTTAGR